MQVYKTPHIDYAFLMIWAFMRNYWRYFLGAVIVIGMVWWLSGGRQVVFEGNLTNGQTDLAVYYAAAQVVMGKTNLTAADIYHQTQFRPVVHKLYEDAGTYFLYPPQAAVLLTPLAITSFAVTVRWWMILNAILFVVATLLWLPRSTWWLALFALTPPIIKNFDTGQVNLVLYILFAMAFVGLMRQRYPWLVGVALGLATLLKIFPIIFLPYLILKKQYKAAISFVVTGCVVTAISLPLFGVAGLKLFLVDRLPDVLSGKIGYVQDSVSLYGSLRTAIDHLPYKHPPIVAALNTPYTLLTASLFVLVGWYLWRTRKQLTVNQFMCDYSIIMLWLILTGKIIHQHYIVWLIPTAIWLWQRFQGKSIWWRIGLAVTIGLVFFQKLVPLADLTDRIIKPVTFGLILLAGLVVCTQISWPKKSLRS